MSKIEFHEITLDDKAWMDARFQEDDRNACEYTFANNFVWRKVYHVEVAEKYGCAIIRFEEEGVQTFFCASIEALIASFISLNTPCIPDTLPEICIFAMTFCTMSCTMRSSTDTLLPPSMRMPHRLPGLNPPAHCRQRPS